MQEVHDSCIPVKGSVKTSTNGNIIERESSHFLLRFFFSRIHSSDLYPIESIDCLLNFPNSKN